MGVHVGAAKGASNAPARPVRDRGGPGCVVLVVDPDSDSREASRDFLAARVADRGCAVQAVGDGQAALDVLARETVDVVVMDLDLPKVSGLNVLAARPALATEARFLVVSESGGVETAVEAMKAGASDCLDRPLDPQRLSDSLEVVLAELRVRRERRRARHPVGRRGLASIVGDTPEMQHVFRLAEKVAPTRAHVLVTGETGTGKDLVARAVHDLSPRSEGPFIAVNCSAIPSTLLEAELFGHTRGSFTGAIQSRKGLIEEAADGTLFLDEISTLSEDVQVKLLRVLQDRRVQRVGSGSAVTVDFRLVAATNKDLADLVRAGRFREDLFFRLDVFPIPVPPLRERRDDILPLTDHFLSKFAGEHGVEAPMLSVSTLSRMLGYDWPGNVRELENFIERSVIMYPGARGFPFDLPRSTRASEEGALLDHAGRDQWTLDRLEREYLLATLERTHWRQAATAEILGINRRTIHRKLKRYQEEGFLPNVDIE